MWIIVHVNTIDSWEQVLKHSKYVEKALLKIHICRYEDQYLFRILTFCGSESLDINTIEEIRQEQAKYFIHNRN